MTPENLPEVSLMANAVTQQVRRTLAMGVLLIIGGSRAVGQSAAYVDTSGHQTSFVRSAPEVTLEVLDWAGMARRW